MTEEVKEDVDADNIFHLIKSARRGATLRVFSQPARPRSPADVCKSFPWKPRGKPSLARHLVVLLENWTSPFDPPFLMLLSAFTLGSTEIFYLGIHIWFQNCLVGLVPAAPIRYHKFLVSQTYSNLSFLLTGVASLLSSFREASRIGVDRTTSRMSSNCPLRVAKASLPVLCPPTTNCGSISI
jgi:hypothetical protein